MAGHFFIKLKHMEKIEKTEYIEPKMRLQEIVSEGIIAVSPGGGEGGGGHDY